MTIPASAADAAMRLPNPGYNRLGIMERVKRHILFIAVSAAVIAADQVSKSVILNLVPLHETITVIPDFLNVVHFRNPGGAFGLFAAQSGFGLGMIFFIITLVALGLIIYLYKQTPAGERLLAAGLALVFGGAVGNLIDRLRFGNVVDFIDLYVKDYHWPAFNVADSAITLGIVIFAFYVIFRKMPA